MSEKNNKFFIPLKKSVGEKENGIEHLLEHSMNEKEETTSKNKNDEGKLLVDLQESDDEFIVLAPLAGIPSANIEVFFEDDVITINARMPHELRYGKTTYRECHFGDVSRSIMLPKNIKRTGHNAELKNGLLIIRFQKIKSTPPKKITITEYNE